MGPRKEPWLDYAVIDDLVIAKAQLLCRDLLFLERYFSKKKR
jgi:hypothetical protein